ncbi:MAG: hypothetical protein KC503_40910 [Myxococcales bacterium]|nr:hypothetical protein [Myxococcales bacterium]
MNHRNTPVAFAVLAAAAVICHGHVGSAAPLTLNHAARLAPKPAAAEVAYDLQGGGALDRGPDGAELSLQTLRARVALPLLRYGSGALLVGAGYQLHSFSLSAPTFSTVTRNLHQLSTQLSWVQGLGRRWSFAVHVAPTLASDMRDIAAEDFVLKGRATLSWSPSDNWLLLAGVAVNRQFGAYVPTPVLGVVYRPQGAGLYVEALLPRRVTVGYKVNRRVELFGEGSISGLWWYARSENEGGPEGYFKYFASQVGLGANVGIVKGFGLRLFGGVMPYGKLEARDGDDNSIDSVVKLAPVMSAALTWRPQQR